MCHNAILCTQTERVSIYVLCSAISVLVQPSGTPSIVPSDWGSWFQREGTSLLFVPVGFPPDHFVDKDVADRRQVTVLSIAPSLFLLPLVPRTFLPSHPYPHPHPHPQPHNLSLRSLPHSDIDTQYCPSSQQCTNAIAAQIASTVGML